MKNILEKINEARSKSKPRNFVQTWDMIINLKGMNLKRPENRFSFDLVLPEGRGKTSRIAIIADSILEDARKHADLVITKDEVEKLGKERKKLKRLANEYDVFFAEAPLMPMIGKSFGAVLGPRGKLPKPLPPKGNITPLIESAKRSVRVAIKDTPVVYIPIGTEKMPDEKIANNATKAFNSVKERLPKGQSNIKSVVLKLTMGKPVKIDV